MHSPIYTVQKEDFFENSRRCLNALEAGNVLFMPENAPSISREQRRKLEPNILDGKHKNLSYDRQRQKLGGLHPMTQDAHRMFLQQFMHDFADFAKNSLTMLIPFYSDALIWGRTSYRPAEIKGRPASKRKDDSRLHVDSFPASPVNGHRILRVFSNINFDGKPRLWHLGEAFADVLEKFHPEIPPYRKSLAHALHWMKATKSLRSPYDHTMLQLHDRMKLSEEYQKSVKKTAFDFPAMTSWIVFTDQVSHAALGGQYLLEQTFYLPVEAMARPDLSPLHQINRLQKAYEVC